jgi:glutaminyl-tRNA synthetase
MKEDPGQVEDGQDFTANLNPKSLEVITACRLEPALANAAAGERYQFERLGYFCVDIDSAAGHPVFNRTVTLKDAWAKIEKRGKQAK